MKIPDYSEIIKTIKIDDSRIIEVQLLKNKFLKGFARYNAVSGIVGVPADVVFGIHYRESDCSFEGCLHNGEEIIGTGQKTTLVPAGRGPFKSWEDSAVDALLMKKAIFPKEWNLSTKMEFAEKYNGLGYRKHDVYSPYVFAGTNFSDELGKYSFDGKFNPSAPDKQLGVAAILLGIG